MQVVLLTNQTYAGANGATNPSEHHTPARSMQKRETGGSGRFFQPGVQSWAQHGAKPHCPQVLPIL